ncbi:MAG: Hsp20 family protein [Methyloceanibacter sp.]
MQRMTLLDGSFWLSLGAPRGPGGAAKAESGYPPYNIELLTGEPETLRITLAVAGFAPDELEVSTENGELCIRGKQGEEGARAYLHRGIAARQFKRSFALASGVEVCKAELQNGLLVIELTRPREAKRVMKIGVAAAD